MAATSICSNQSSSRLTFKVGALKFNGSKSGRRCAIPDVVKASIEQSDSNSNISIWKKAGAAAVLSAAMCLTPPAMADLNKYEAAAGGEFGNGTAQQYGEADLRGRDFHGEVGVAHFFSVGDDAFEGPYLLPAETRFYYDPLQDLRRSNFTAADCRSCNFKDAKLQVPTLCI